MLYVFDCGTISLKGNYLTWKIYNFFSLPLNKDCEIRSTHFVYGDSRYSLFIWPHGRKGSGTEEWLGICLYKYDAPGKGDSVHFSIPMDLGNIKTCKVKCSEYNLFRQEEFIEWTDFQILKHMIVPNGCLTIACKLFIENWQRNHKESRNYSGAFLYPICDPRVMHPCANFHWRNPFARSTSFRISYPETKSAFFTNTGFNYGGLSTMNPFYNSSSFETRFQHIPESIETQNSDFIMPYWVSGTTSGNTLRDRYLRGLGIANKPRPSTSSGKDIPCKETSVCDSPNLPIDSTNVPKNENSSEMDGTANGLASTAISCPKSTQDLEPFKNAAPYLKSLKALSQHFKNLYFAGNDFDLTIIMEGKEFKVIKSILKARSPVFAKWLSKDVRGKNTNNIITIDPFDACDSSVFHHFLLYVYSGEIECIAEKNIYGLYCASQKFQMPELKEECIKYLQTLLSAGNITGIFRSADSSDSELLDVAIAFLAKNMEVTLNTDEWKEFARQQPDRASEYHLKALKIDYTKKIASETN